MIRKIIYILSICITSCSSIPGYYSGYKKLSTEDRQKIKKLESKDIDTLQNDGNIYIINAEQILGYIKKKDRVLVYDWSPNCTSDICVPLDFIEKFCQEKGLKLLVIMEYYSIDLIPTPQNFSKPIFFIDSQYYHSDYCNKYTQRFYKALSGKSFKELNYGRHYYFVNGRFEGVYDNYIKERLRNN